jgi:RNA polymerase sigma-70 factor (ECF subfamily)
MKKVGDNTELLTDWYNTYHTHLANISTRLGYGGEETKDAIHQFFLDLLEKKLELASIENPQAYLSVAFRRKLIDYHRSSSKQVVKSFSDVLDVHTSPSVQETIEQIQASTQLIADIRKAYYKLPERCRKVIYLKFFEGLSTEQIAERTGLRKRSVYNNLFEGVKLLRAELQATSPQVDFRMIISLLGICLINGIM